MARVNRRAKKRRDGYDEQHISQLLRGVALSPGCGFRTHGHESDFDAMREGWEALRDTLLPEFIAEHPGERPYAWWKFDAPEPRQRIDADQHPFDNPDRQCRVELMAIDNPSFRDTAYETFYGRPRALVIEDDFAAKFEGELAYLDRLGLLTAYEKTELYGT
jgi:hypothetical protein